MISRKDQVQLVMRETLNRTRMERRADKTPVPDTSHYKDAFAGQGAVAQALSPIFHFNALATSRMLPSGGLLLHIGYNSVPYLNYLAQRRPDIHIIGLEQSADLVEQGQAALEESGMGERVRLYAADITQFAEQTPEAVSLITSTNALHQLQTPDALQRCLHEMALLRVRIGCGLWLFDYVRPGLLRTAEEYPALAMTGTPVQLRLQVRNSLLAAYSFAELSDILDKLSVGRIQHAIVKSLPIFQAHWLERDDQVRLTGHQNWIESRLSATALEDFNNLKKAFPTVLLPQHLS